MYKSINIKKITLIHLKTSARHIEVVKKQAEKLKSCEMKERRMKNDE